MITVASLVQIMDVVGSLDSSRDLQLICVKSFVNKFYLILYACVQTLNVMGFRVNFLDLSIFHKPLKESKTIVYIAKSIQRHYQDYSVFQATRCCTNRTYYSNGLL